MGIKQKKPGKSAKKQKVIRTFPDSGDPQGCSHHTRAATSLVAANEKKTLVLIIQSCGVGFLITEVTRGSDIGFHRGEDKKQTKNSDDSPRSVPLELGFESLAAGGVSVRGISEMLTRRT